MTESVDLAPTILDYLGALKYHLIGMGESLLKYVKNQKNEIPPKIM